MISRRGIFILTYFNISNIYEVLSSILYFLSDVEMAKDKQLLTMISSSLSDSFSSSIFFFSKIWTILFGAIVFKHWIPRPFISFSTSKCNQCLEFFIPYF